MKLTVSDVKKITFGALRVEEKEDGLHFYHATENQSKAWMAEDRGVGERSYATTGVCFDFHTDSSVFGFTRVSDDPVKKGQYEIRVNDVTVRHVKSAEEEAGISVPLPAGEKRVTLIFPSHSVGILRDVILSDGAHFTPHVYRRKIYCFGDSITQGWDSGYDSHSWAWRLGRFYDAEMLIQGVGGAIFLPEAVDKVDFEPDLLIVSLGVNHNGRRHEPEKVEPMARETLEKLAAYYPNARKAAISPTWYRPSSEKEEDIARADAIRATVEKVISETGYELIPGLSLLPAIREYYADGHLHPNAIGFSLMAENIIRYLEGRG